MLSVQENCGGEMFHENGCIHRQLRQVVGRREREEAAEINPIRINFSSELSFSLNSSFATLPIPQLDGSDEFIMELEPVLTLFPEEMRRRLDEHREHRHLIEVVMDLGRKPLARFPSGDFVLSEYPITLDDFERVTSMVGDFAIHNRTGISNTLHRISVLRNRNGVIIGLTCRVVRAVSGIGILLRDLVEDGGSLLLVGPPGVGKTNVIRDIARILADDYGRRVMIVDTSNEIAGDGDIPYAGIGNARRIQVPHSMQHKVLIEAIQNHRPQVLVVDQIGTKLEATVASTIAQRGVQLVATVHAKTIKNIITNPSLAILVGGVEDVTLGDEEARRGVRKIVQKRKGPSPFNSVVEMISHTELRVHPNLEATVDVVLSGRLPRFEVRKINQGSEDVIIEKQCFVRDSSNEINGIIIDNISEIENEGSKLDDVINEDNTGGNFGEDGTPLKLFIYGISEMSVVQVINQLEMDNEIKLTNNINKADALLALRPKLKKNSGIQAVARSHGLLIYVTKTSSLQHLTNAIRALIVDRAEGKINV